MVLTMATVMGWAGGGSNARASGAEQSTAASPTSVAQFEVPTLTVDSTRVADGEWRYVASRR